MDYSVVIPVYNERDNLEILLKSLTIPFMRFLFQWIASERRKESYRKKLVQT